MLITLIRTIIIYLVLLIALRTLGKSELSQLQPIELALIIIIAEIAAFPLDNIDIPLIRGVVSIFTLVFLQMLLSFVALKNIHFRKVMCGKPTIVINKGSINEKVLRNQSLNLNDLLEQLRIKGYSDISDIDYAILETNGELSVFPRERNEKKSYPFPVIIDGDYLKDNIKMLGKEVQEIDKLYSIKRKNVLLLTLDRYNNHKLYIRKKLR